MSILIYTLKSIAYALTEPYLLLLLAIMAFTLYRKNSQTAIMQKMIIGEPVDSPFELTISQIVIGIFAGTAASIIMSYLGIIFDESSSVELVFLASIIFMFFNPRFICFSYSGAVLGMTSIILSAASSYFHVPGLDFLNIDVVSLMSMVAVLHFIEGILVMLDGGRGSIPVFTNKSGSIIGGFALQRYWIIPVAIFFMLHGRSEVSSVWQVSTPNWWPILKNPTVLNALKAVTFTLMPFYAVLGYNTVTFTKSVKQKSHISGSLILLYSLALFMMAQLANFSLYLKILLLIFAPLAHEGIIILQRYIEAVSQPKYVSSNEGIMVLAVAPNSPANEMGIKSGDLLVEINNNKIENEEKILEVIRDCSNFIWLKIKKVTGKIEQVSYNKMSQDKKLGIVFVPKTVPKDSMIIKLNKSKFSDVLKKIKNKDKDD